MRITRTVQFLLILTIVLRTLGSFDARALEPQLLTGNKLRKDLDQLYAINLSRTDLRQFVNQASVDRHISIIIDRRLDTSAEFPLSLKNSSLQKGLMQIAGLTNAELIVFDNLVYLGPKSSTTKSSTTNLRTLAELRKLDLSLKEFVVPDRRRSELLRRQNFAWQDLDSAREILVAIANPNHLTISNIELIPHDLWPAATIPDLSVIDALTIVLIQFDFTFQWRETGRSIELVPIPDHVVIERKFRTKQKLSDAIALIRQRVPGVDAQIVNSEIVVKATLEDCETVASLLSGKAGKKTSENDSSQDLSKQRLTLTTPVPIPLIDIMKQLEGSGIVIEYDANEMKDAGVDFEKPVTVDVKDKPAEECFKALFGPVKVDFQIDQMTVKLTPKKRR